MKRTISLLALGGVALLAFAQADFTGAVSNALKSAKTLSAEIKVIPVSGAASTIRVEVEKPNKARIDSMDRLVVADGKDIVTFDKKQKVYVKSAQTDAELKKLFGTDELRPWAAFFDADALGKLPKPTVTNRQGLKSATYALGGKDSLTLMVDPSDNVARKAVIEKLGASTILEAKVAVNGAIAASAFKFDAPAGSKEVKLEELMADKWFTNLEEAKQAAAKTGRMIFVDFMADWCGPCKMLEAEVLSTPKFKALSSKYVFLKIDVDRQKDVASMYKIEAMPTQMIITSTGKEVKRVVGYGGPEMFYREFGF